MSSENRVAEDPKAPPLPPVIEPSPLQPPAEVDPVPPTAEGADPK
ncbi:hypothetical protein [Sphingomonas arenae]|nr:hypothetical protein [Sphingomonas arenae]